MGKFKELCTVCGDRIFSVDEQPDKHMISQQTCDLCGKLICEDCRDWSIDARHMFPDASTICRHCTNNM